MPAKISAIIIGFILLLLIASCDDLTYSPEGENVVDVPKASANLVVDLDSAPDTLYTYGEINLKYSIDTDGKRLSSVNIFIDSLYAGSGNIQSGFTLNTENYSNGIHKLKLEICVYSGSGSLADKYYNEYLKSYKEWNIFIDNRELSSPLKIDSVYRSDGRVKIEWQKYPYLKFGKYLVYAKHDNSDGQFHLIGTISDKNRTNWLDSNFIGGTTRYRIDASSTGEVITEGKEKSFSDEVPALYSLEKINNEKVIIKWKKNKYYKNFKICKLYRNSYRGNYGTIETLADFENVEDTSFTDIPPFAAEADYFITMESGKYDYPSYLTSERATVSIGEKFPPFYSLYYVPGSNSIYCQDDQMNYVRLDAETFQEKARCDYHLFVSNNGSYAFTNNIDKVSLHPHSFTRLDPLTLQPIGNTFTTKSFMNYTSINNFVNVLEDGSCLYLGYRYTEDVEYGPPVVVLINTDPVKILMRDSSKYSPGAVLTSNLSDQGQYIFIGSKLYNFKDNKIKFLRQINTGQISIAFFTASGKEYVINDNNTITVYDCSSNNLVKSFSVGQELRNITYDPSTGYFGGEVYDTDKFRIYDLRDGKVIMEKKILMAPAYMTMANSCLFARGGYYMKLNFGE